MIQEQDDDVIQIGKLRRPGRPAASVTYDPGYGMRVDGEGAPPDAEQAARWVKASGGWLRLRGDVRRLAKAHPEVAYFLKAVRRR
ncbi:MAG: hypothetical protein KGZ65_04110 [Sphingomonadales bacterium]|nr:hypothetical protein [Sphingomonadaceae bacterium]MBS3930397.1 hypothetical protein [Sphingomonadales bacterium]